MLYNDEKMTDIQIAYIGGGSRGWAWTFMSDLALEPKLGGHIRLYDIDSEAAEKNKQIGNQLTARPESVGKWEYTTAATLAEALTGADFIIISILPGTFDEMQSDVHAPERFGIYQSVGDTAGPGGIIRALRTIPMFVEIAKAIETFAPDAWVINYTNPMSICVKTLYHVFPKIKAFGCCHEVFGTQKVLKGIVQNKFGIENIDRKDIFVNVLGINHFTWFDEASYKGLDLFPIYEDYIEQHFEEGYVDTEEHWANASFGCANRVKFDLFRRYGAIAAAGDRHLAEFMPSGMYLKNPDTVTEWKFGLTTVDWRKEDLQNRLAKGNRLLDGTEVVALKSSGEEGISLIKALCGLESIVSNVNMPNTHLQIENLPANAIVETNALFRRNSIRPVFAGRLPEEILQLVWPHVENHERTLMAALQQDKGFVVEAFQKDPLLGGQLSDADIRSLVDEMIGNTLAYLPKGWEKQR